MCLWISEIYIFVWCMCACAIHFSCFCRWLTHARCQLKSNEFSVIAFFPSPSSSSSVRYLSWWLFLLHAMLMPMPRTDLPICSVCVSHFLSFFLEWHSYFCSSRYPAKRFFLSLSLSLVCSIVYSFIGIRQNKTKLNSERMKRLIMRRKCVARAGNASLAYFCMKFKRFISREQFACKRLANES